MTHQASLINIDSCPNCQFSDAQNQQEKEERRARLLELAPQLREHINQMNEPKKQNIINFFNQRMKEEKYPHVIKPEASFKEVQDAIDNFNKYIDRRKAAREASYNASETPKNTATSVLLICLPIILMIGFALAIILTIYYNPILT